VVVKENSSERFQAVLGPSTTQELASCSPAIQGFHEVILENVSVAWVLDGRGKVADAVMVTATVDCALSVLLEALGPSSDGDLSRFPGFSHVCLVSRGSVSQPCVSRGTIAVPVWPFLLAHQYALAILHEEVSIPVQLHKQKKAPSVPHSAALLSKTLEFLLPAYLAFAPGRLTANDLKHNCPLAQHNSIYV
jgi:hypothetical protein